MSVRVKLKAGHPHRNMRARLSDGRVVEIDEKGVELAPELVSGEMRRCGWFEVSGKGADPHGPAQTNTDDDLTQSRKDAESAEESTETDATKAEAEKEAEKARKKAEKEAEKARKNAEKEAVKKAEKAAVKTAGKSANATAKPKTKKAK